LGSNLAEEVLQRGDSLCVFDNLSRLGSRQNLEWLQHTGLFDFRHGDIRSQNDVDGVVADFRPDVIFHLAGQVAMTTSIASPRLDFEVNALGTLNLMESVRVHAPQAIVIYSSSNKVYGDLTQYSYRETKSRYECVEHPAGFDEQTPLTFHSPYGCSKGSADQYMLDYARIYGLRTVVFRHSSMYGSRQFATQDQGWIGWFCQKALEAKSGVLTVPFTIAGSGKQVRDVLHADDMKNLYFTAAEHIDQAAGQAFNIGGGMENSLSLLELFAMLGEMLNVSLSFASAPTRQSDQRVFVADIAKAKSSLNWEPSIGASDGIRRLLRWLMEVNHIDI